MPIATPQGTLDFKSVDTITFVGASSNTVIDTTTGSLGVGVDVNGPTSNLHVVGHTRLEGDINMLHTSNNSSMKVNSNVVTEFPRSKKLIKYPRVALTGPSAPMGYAASASRENGVRQAYTAFDGDDTTFWQIVNSPDRYDTSGNATSDATLFEGDNGEWIKILLPDKVKISSIRRRATNSARRPTNCKLYGSNDDTTWHLLEYITFSNTDWADGNVNTNNYYNYFVLQVLTVSGNGQNVDMKELEYFGTPEYDPEAHGTDVVVKSLPNVPNTDFLDVFVDAGNASGFTLSGSDVTGVTDLSTPANTMTVNGNVTYNSVNKAFVFPGTGSSYMRATLVDGDGNYPLTLSVWFMMTDYNANSWRSIITVGTSGTGEQASIAYDPNQDQLYFGTYGADIYVPHTPELGKWNHVAATFTGGSTTSSTMNVYLNGVNMGGVPNGTQTPSFTNNQFVIGGAMNSNGTTVNNPFKGQIANARFYRRAYTSDEIYQLYAYQKEYFGHGDLGMTLKAGRLGIGTSEPRAALDVRGDLYAPGTIVQVEQAVKTNTSAVTSTSAVDIGYLSVDITPKFSTSKILVSYIVNVGVDITGTTNMHGFLRVKRTQGGISTYIGDGASSGDRQACTSYIYNTANAMCESFSFEHLDDANGTGTVTYTIQGLVEASVYTMTINRSGSDGNNGYYGRTSSSITVKEVCQ
jgi:hypothetical protein